MRRSLLFALTAITVARPAVAAPAESQVPLTYNHDCIAPAYVVAGEGDCNGSLATIVDNADLPAAGPFKAKGITFTFPSHTADNVVAAVGQTVTLPGAPGHKYLHLLDWWVTAEPSTAQRTFVVTYKDGSKQTVVLPIQDIGFKSPTSVFPMDAQTPDNPGAVVGGNNIAAHLDTIVLDPKKTAVSLKLPTTAIPQSTNLFNGPSVQVLAATLSTKAASASAVVFN